METSSDVSSRFTLPPDVRSAIIREAGARGLDANTLVARVVTSVFGSDWLLRLALQEDAWKDGKYTLTLTKPITTEDGPQDSLTLLEPSGGDVMAAGNPVKFNPFSDPPVIEIDEKKMAAMIARCAKITPVFLGRMAPKDIIAAGWVLAPFFIPA